MNTLTPILTALSHGPSRLLTSDPNLMSWSISLLWVKVCLGRNGIVLVVIEIHLHYMYQDTLAGFPLPLHL